MPKFSETFRKGREEHLNLLLAQRHRVRVLEFNEARDKESLNQRNAEQARLKEQSDRESSAILSGAHSLVQPAANVSTQLAEQIAGFQFPFNNVGTMIELGEAIKSNKGLRHGEEKDQLAVAFVEKIILEMIGAPPDNGNRMRILYAADALMGSSANGAASVKYINGAVSFSKGGFGAVKYEGVERSALKGDSWFTKRLGGGSYGAVFGYQGQDSDETEAFKFPSNQRSGGESDDMDGGESILHEWVMSFIVGSQPVKDLFWKHFNEHFDVFDTIRGIPINLVRDINDRNSRNRAYVYPFVSVGKFMFLTDRDTKVALPCFQMKMYHKSLQYILLKIKWNKHAFVTVATDALMQVSIAMNGMHKIGISHRDLSCGNVFARDDGQFRDRTYVKLPPKGKAIVDDNLLMIPSRYRMYVADFGNMCSERMQEVKGDGGNGGNGGTSITNFMGGEAFLGDTGRQGSCDRTSNDLFALFHGMMSIMWSEEDLKEAMTGSSEEFGYDMTTTIYARNLMILRKIYSEYKKIWDTIYEGSRSNGLKLQFRPQSGSETFRIPQFPFDPRYHYASSVAFIDPDLAEFFNSDNIIQTMFDKSVQAGGGGVEEKMDEGH